MRSLAAALLIASGLFAQAPSSNCTTSTFTVTANGSTPNVDNRNNQCAAWRITFYRTGFSAATVTFQKAEDTSGTPGAFSAFSGAEIVEGALPMTGASGTAVTRAMYPWVRATVSGTSGSGKIVVVMVGVKGTEMPPASAPAATLAAAVWGPDAAGVAPTEPPVQMGSYDGVNVQRTLSDSAGRLIVNINGSVPITGTTTVVGPAAAGAAVSGNPVRTGASDGTTTRDILSDSAGRLQAVGAAANAAAVAGNPLLVAGYDGTLTRTISTDTAGRPNVNINGTVPTTGTSTVTGPAANGAAVSGNPVRTGASDGTTTRDILSDSSGRLIGVGAAASGSAVAGNPVLGGGSDGTNARTRLMASITNLTAALNSGAALGEKGPRWSVTSAPGAGNQATASKTAGGNGVRHVIDCISFSAEAGVAPAATAQIVNVRDGATGAGTVILQFAAFFPAAVGQSVPPHSVCGLNLIGSNNTAMTIEFGAGVASVSQAVNITGYDVQ